MSPGTPAGAGVDRRGAPWPAAVGLLLAGFPLAAPALDRFEIQVYQADVNEPGQFGVEVHANYTVKGETVPVYPGEVPPDQVFRLTLEPALGVTRWLELGGYLPNDEYRLRFQLAQMFQYVMLHEVKKNVCKGSDIIYSIISSGTSLHVGKK